MAQAGEAINDKSPEIGSKSLSHPCAARKAIYIFFFLPKALQNQILDKKIHVKLLLIFQPSFALKEHLFPHTSLIKDDKVSEMSQLSFIS